jgi:hypothetical protein
MVRYKKLGLVLGAVAMLALLPAKADAQFIRYSPIFWSFDVNAGIELPMSDLSDVAKPGFTVGAGWSYFLNPRLALTARGGVGFLSGESNALFNFEGGVAPDLTLFHYTAGIEGHLADPMGDLLATINVGAGGATFNSDLFVLEDVDCSGPACIDSPGASTTSTGFDQTYFALQGGLTLGYNFSRSGTNNVPVVTLFISGNAHLIFGDEDHTRILAAGGSTSPWSTMFTIPITAGLRFNIP